MCIKMKAKNNEYTFIMNEEVSFSLLLKKLESLLDQSIFKNIVIYPQAFFDFQRRIVKEEELESLLDLLLKKQVLLFGGIVCKQQTIEKDIQVIEKTIHGGEVETYYRSTLLIGNINPGAQVICDDDFYVLGKVSGTIQSYNKNVTIHCQSIEKGNILISNEALQNITTSAPTKVYYQDNEIVCCKGEMKYGENNCSNIR